MRTKRKEMTGLVEPTAMRKRIGSTVYEVRVYFNRDAKEEMGDKIIRMVRNDLNKPRTNVNMAVPQTNWLPGKKAA